MNHILLPLKSRSFAGILEFLFGNLMLLSGFLMVVACLIFEIAPNFVVPLLFKLFGVTYQR